MPGENTGKAVRSRPLIPIESTQEEKSGLDEDLELRVPPRGRIEEAAGRDTGLTALLRNEGAFPRTDLHRHTGSRWHMLTDSRSDV